MTALQIIVLALVQGLTEFLPVSSSAHLILVSRFSSWPDQGLVLDVAVHMGTLLSVLLYFRKDLAGLVLAWIRPGQVEKPTEKRRLGLHVLLASVPVLVVGLLAHDFIADYLRELWVIAIATLVFGVMLWIADARFSSERKLEEMHHSGAVLVGLAQVLALVPGTSRSGVTIMMGRMLGFGRQEAARFSFLLSIPVIAAAGGYDLLRLAGGESEVAWSEFGLAVGVAAVAGWVCIAAFLNLLTRVGLLPFIIYRLILGLALVVVLL